MAWVAGLGVTAAVGDTPLPEALHAGLRAVPVVHVEVHHRHAPREPAAVAFQSVQRACEGERDERGVQKSRENAVAARLPPAETICARAPKKTKTRKPRRASLPRFERP